MRDVSLVCPSCLPSGHHQSNNNMLKPDVPVKPVWLVGVDVASLHSKHPTKHHPTKLHIPRDTPSPSSPSPSPSPCSASGRRARSMYVSGAASSDHHHPRPRHRHRHTDPPCDLKELLTPRRHLFMQTGSLDACSSDCSPPSTPLITSDAHVHHPGLYVIQSPGSPVTSHRVCRSISTDSGLGVAPPSKNKVRVLTDR